MPTKVFDLDVDALPTEITGLDGYEDACILLRLHGRPIGSLMLPIRSGRIGGADLRESVKSTVGTTIWERSMRAALKWDEAAATGYEPPKATVVVCTRDRTDDLRRCLDALLRLPDDGQEYLVIDNCPATDDTRQLLSHYAGRVRYVREDRPGASAARNRGLREAQHEIVAFTDDDAAPDPGWLRALVRDFSDPLVLCVTGLVMPLELETSAQQWFERYSPFGRGFARVVFDCANHDPLNAAPVGVSASVAFRKTVIDAVGPFDDTLGPGTPALAGEDYELFSRILTSGYRIVYEPAALSWHRHRRTWKELRRTIYGYGVSVYAFWTRALIVDGEFAVVRLAWGWFRYKQGPNLIRSALRRSTRLPLDLLVAELCGCAVGPWAYLSSRRRARLVPR